MLSRKYSSRPNSKLMCSKTELAQDAKFFAVERSPGSQSDKHHFNLWGIDPEGKEILFTHDHVIARIFGGADDMSNSVTACEICNGEKAKRENKILSMATKQKIQMSPNWLVTEVKNRYSDPEILKYWWM